MTAYEMRISDWSSDVCSSDLPLVNGWALYTGSKAKRDRPPSRWSKHGELPAQHSRAGLRGSDRATRSIGNLVIAASRTRSRRDRQFSLLMTPLSCDFTVSRPPPPPLSHPAPNTVVSGKQWTDR